MKILFCVLGTILCALSTNAFPRPKVHVPPQCIDPTFACQDLQSARLCNTVSPCIHDVWATMTAPDDNDEVCDICKEMVKEARDQLLSNMTQEEIKEVFEGSCKLLPIKILAEGCIKVVDEIIPQLVEMLASRMDPSMVCTVSGMCFATAETPFAKFLKLIMSFNKDNECAECTTMMTDVKTFLNTASEAEVKTYVETFCDEKMPSYLCDMIVDSYLPSVYSYIINTDAKSLCSSVGVCPKLCKPREVTNFNDELTCEFCEHVLQHMKDLITANTTAEEFKTALLNFCKHTGKFSDKCTEIVNDYYDMLFDYIRGLDTKGMCTLIGLCNNSGKRCSSMPMIKLIPAKEAHRRVPMTKIQPADDVLNYYHSLIKVIPAEVASKKDIETNDIFPSPLLPVERFIHPLGIFQKDTECAFCKAISFFLEKELKQDRSEDGVQVALKNVCERWVTDFPKECDQFINKHSKKIQHAIVNGVQLDDMCAYSKVCETEEGKKEIGIRVLPKTKAGPFCDLCKDTMTEVENTLSDPATKQKLKDTFDQACNILPKSLKEDCDTFINSNIDAIIDILQQELRPDNICPALKLCDAKSRLQVSERVKDMECNICKQVATSLRQKLSDPNAKKIVLTFLEEGCVRLPGTLAQECKSFVDENIDTILGMIIQELDPDTVCSILKICKDTTVKAEQPRKVKDLECELCKEVVGKVEDMVKDKKTEDEIKSALEKVCSYLPSHMVAKCNSFVDTYIDTLITLLIEEVDPDTICAALKVCPGSVKVEQPRKVKDLECELCKEVVGKVEDMVKDKKTEAEIKSALEKVCSYLPSHMVAKCDSFVDTYIDTLITLLIDEVDPDTICAALKVCPGSVKVEKPRKVKDIECDLCKEVVGKVEDMVKDPKTEEEIQSALDRVCSYLPSSMSAKCKNFVDNYTKTLITLLMAEMDPDMVCAALNVCPAADLECQGCQYGLHFLQEQLTNPSTQEELKNLLKKVCDVLPATYANNCEAFVNEYGSSLLVLIAQEIDPGTLCFELKLCTNQPKIFEKNISILHPFNNDECSICTTVVDYVDKLLEEDDVDKEITKLVEKVCTVLPASYGQTCTTTLETYGPYILQMIGQLADSKQVCQEIDMCARPPGHVHLLGGNKCTFGPSYWCKTSAHASACKAEEFCKDKFWNN